MRIRRPLTHSRLVWLPIALLSVTVGAAQQKGPFRNNTPVAPQGIQVPPLPDKPVEFHTAEGQDIRVAVLVKGLAHPWSLAFLPDGSMLVTERVGRLRIIRGGLLRPEPIGGVPAVHTGSQAGLFG